MKCSRIPQGTHLFALFTALAVLALAVGCASTAPLRLDEGQLAAAGFKVLVATTKQQQEHVQSLPPGQITAMQRTGVHFYVYPDPAGNKIYVGTPKEYAAYQRLQPGGTTLAAQQAADMASYNKQDEAMRRATTRDLNDPYYFWPSWIELGW